MNREGVWIWRSVELVSGKCGTATSVLRLMLPVRLDVLILGLTSVNTPPSQTHPSPTRLSRAPRHVNGFLSHT